MRALTIGRIALLRLFRERSNVFFVFVFPLALVLLIGLQFGGGAQRSLAVVAPDGGTVDELTAALAEKEDVVLEPAGDRASAADAVARGEVDAALVFPDDFSEAVAGGGARIEFLSRPGGGGMALRPVVSEIVGEESVALGAAAVAGELTGRRTAGLLPTAREAAAVVTGVRIDEITVEGDPLAAEFAGVNPFAVGASSQLVLFVFLTSLVGASTLIEERNLGMLTRILSTPTRTRELLLGAATGRFAVAAFQGLYIALGSLVIFGVGWGDPVAAGLVIVVFSAVSAGATMLLGASVDNDAQAGGAGIGIGLGLAALGAAWLPWRCSRRRCAGWRTPPPTPGPTMPSPS